MTVFSAFIAEYFVLSKDPLTPDSAAPYLLLHSESASRKECTSLSKVGKATGTRQRKKPPSNKQVAGCTIHSPKVYVPK
jgi:hypothetical protein